MSSITPRYPSPLPRPGSQEPEVKLRTPSQAYPQKGNREDGQERRQEEETVYAKRNHDSHKLKKLSFWGNADLETGEEDEWAERQSPTPFILIAVILVVAGSLLWFIFRWASAGTSSAPPIILPDAAPFKVRPENPGGIRIPHQDKLVYGRLSQDPCQPIERLLPPPEQPMEHPAAPPQVFSPGQPAPYHSHPPAGAHNGAVAYPPNPSYGESLTPVQPYGSPSHEQQIQGQAFQGQLPQGGEQGTVPFASPQPYRQHPSSGLAPYPALHHPAPQPGQAVPDPYPAPQGQPPYGIPGTPQPYAPASALPQPATPETSVISPIEGIRPASDEEADENPQLQEGRHELDQLIEQEARTPLKPVPKNTVFRDMPGKLSRPMALNPAEFKVQIASLPSRPMAEQEMRRLRISHKSFFEHKPWNIQKVDLGAGRGVTHRLIVGAFSNREMAARYCKRLQAQKIGCMVVAPASKSGVK